MVENMNSLAHFDWTRLVIVIIVQNIGIQLEVQANNSLDLFSCVHTQIIFSEEVSFCRIARRGRVIRRILVPKANRF